MIRFYDKEPIGLRVMSISYENTLNMPLSLSVFRLGSVSLTTAWTTPYTKIMETWFSFKPQLVR